MHKINGSFRGRNGHSATHPIRQVIGHCRRSGDDKRTSAIGRTPVIRASVIFNVRSQCQRTRAPDSFESLSQHQRQTPVRLYETFTCSAAVTSISTLRAAGWRGLAARRRV